MQSHKFNKEITKVLQHCYNILATNNGSMKRNLE